MYERFTDRARKVMVLAKGEAQRLKQDVIGTEHILVGLIQEGSGVAAHVLTRFGIDLQKVRLEVENTISQDAEKAPIKRGPQMSGANRLVENSLVEAHKLNHHYVGTEHLLLGLVREERSFAGRVLTNLGLKLDVIRDEVLNLLGYAIEPATPSSSNIADTAQTLVAVDIGNSGIKLGKFVRDINRTNTTDPRASHPESRSLPEPIATFELPIAHETGEFDTQALAAWCEQHLAADTHWFIGSVHRGAGDLLATTLTAWSKQLGASWPIRRLTYQDVALQIRVEEPPRVGIDRLLAAVAANHLRAADRAAIVVDLGTAITVDLVEADGAYAGGAILPGIGMSGRALAEQTDALPRVVLDLNRQPTPLGKTTVGCIEAGLYWGAVGAIGELIRQLTSQLSAEPDCFITGGASAAFVEPLQAQARVRHEPHLVLAGIALLDAHS